MCLERANTAAAFEILLNVIAQARDEGEEIPDSSMRPKTELSRRCARIAPE